jgi:hypothetical protein
MLGLVLRIALSQVSIKSLAPASAIVNRKEIAGNRKKGE